MNTPKLPEGMLIASYHINDAVRNYCSDGRGGFYSEVKTSTETKETPDGQKTNSTTDPDSKTIKTLVL